MNAQVVTVRSKEEQEFLKSLDKVFWLGASSKTKWTDSSTIAFSVWGESVAFDIFPSDQCAGFLPVSWEIVDCSDKMFTLCEKQLNATTPTPRPKESGMAKVNKRLASLEAGLAEVLKLVRKGQENMKKLESRIDRIGSNADRNIRSGHH